MNDAEKEAIRCLGFSLTKVCPRHSEDEECALCDGTGKIYTCEGLGVISKFTQTLQKKQDEIERLKKIIAGIDVKNPDAVDVMIDAMKEQKEYIQSLKNKLRDSEDEVERLREIVQIPRTFGGEK